MILFLRIGAWVCFNKLHLLTASVLSEFAKLMSHVIGNLRNKRMSAQLLGEEVQLNPKAACLAVTSSLIEVNRVSHLWKSMTNQRLTVSC